MVQRINVFIKTFAIGGADVSEQAVKKRRGRPDWDNPPCMEELATFTAHSWNVAAGQQLPLPKQSTAVWTLLVHPATVVLLCQVIRNIVHCIPSGKCLMRDHNGISVGVCSA
jgi:uncharacterized iron-regulated membrane protein